MLVLAAPAAKYVSFTMFDEPERVQLPHTNSFA
ncbi:hypothetical protein AT05_11340 [Schleiferia thermophila str. Yellowstone]|nr:hypothetical protein AT05_11340 [Schleiferia thermophila str. Yellowstone]